MVKFSFTFVLSLVVLCMALGANATKIRAVSRQGRVSSKKVSRSTVRGAARGMNLKLKTSVRQDWFDEDDKEVDDEEFYRDEAADEDFADDDGEGEDEFDDDFGNEGDFGDDDFGDEPEPVATPPPAPKPVSKPKPVVVAKPVSVPQLHMEYTTKFPKSCACKLGQGMHNGVCWVFKTPGASSGPCSSRKCKPSYMCVDGMATGLTCIRKLNTQTIVSDGDGTCSKKSTSSYGYALYSGR